MPGRHVAGQWRALGRGGGDTKVRGVSGWQVPPRSLEIRPLNKGPPEWHTVIRLTRAPGTLRASKFVPGVVLTRCGQVTDMRTTVFEESLHSQFPRGGDTPGPAAWRSRGWPGAEGSAFTASPAGGVAEVRPASPRSWGFGGWVAKAGLWALDGSPAHTSLGRFPAAFGLVGVCPVEEAAGVGSGLVGVRARRYSLSPRAGSPGKVVSPQGARPERCRNVINRRKQTRWLVRLSRGDRGRAWEQAGRAGVTVRTSGPVPAGDGG